MPRHLISDAHEWITEIPNVPIYYLSSQTTAKRIRSSAKSAEKEDLVEPNFSLVCEKTSEV